MLTCCHGSSLSLYNDDVVYQIDEVEYNDDVKAFHKKVTQIFHRLSVVKSSDLLSVSWISKLLDGFLLCQEKFRVLLENNESFLSEQDLKRLVSDYFERSMKSLDVCNAIRDGIEEMMQWRNQLEIVYCALNDQKTLGEAQFRRAKRALNDLEIKMIGGKESSVNVAKINCSFNMKLCRQESESLQHSNSFVWSVSKSWSAWKQVQAIGNNIVVPKISEIIATNGLVLPIYTMSHVLHFVMWALVAAIPCQGRRAQSRFIFPKNFTWGFCMFKLQRRILDEYKKQDRKNTCGLLKEILGVEMAHDILCLSLVAEPRPPRRLKFFGDSGFERWTLCVFVISLTGLVGFTPMNTSSDYVCNIRRLGSEPHDGVHYQAP
ncbi:hypothetical protein CTI12_AA186290 [Artemisia annua]|uniref:Uncharacterized protein n=1 Tax=Artemisia annua TaxID=35608 RepID=A0A2U1NJU5_ARTAN|nr:hypothetical protein CTI12_AA186290 [Artemisia annua]